MFSHGTKKALVLQHNHRTGALTSAVPPKFILTNALIPMYYHTWPAVTCRHVSPTPELSPFQLALTGPFPVLPMAAIPPSAALCAYSKQLLVPVNGL